LPVEPDISVDATDFEFTPERSAFADEVEHFLHAHQDPDVFGLTRGNAFGLTRENMAQLVDTSKHRAFTKELWRRGWLGLTWPERYGVSDGEGIYEYILNEALAARGGPQIGKGVAVGYSEPDAGSDAASMRLRATRIDPTNKHMGMTLMLVPLDQNGITITGIQTMGDDRTNGVWFDEVFVPHSHVVGEVNHGFRYISRAPSSATARGSCDQATHGPGPHRGRSVERAFRIDVSPHGDRHHRWRRLGDSEKHHRPTWPRPRESCLTTAPTTTHGTAVGNTRAIDPTTRRANPRPMLNLDFTEEQHMLRETVRSI